MTTDREPLDAQRRHWRDTFAGRPDMFGRSASYPAKRAAEILKKEGKTTILELGGGQGRDAVFFARNGFHVHALDYCEDGVEAISSKIRGAGWPGNVTALCHDVRNPLPFADESFDACYSHMLYCMALTTPELESLSDEIRRVLKPDGLNIYTVRNTSDPDFGTGIHRGENMYEVEGFVIHFFTRKKVEELAKGYQLLSIEEFEEGDLPKRLFLVMLRKA